MQALVQLQAQQLNTVVGITSHIFSGLDSRAPANTSGTCNTVVKSLEPVHDQTMF